MIRTKRTLIPIVQVNEVIFRMMLKRIHSRFSGIQTYDLCLVTGARSLPCKEGNFQVVGFKMIH